MVIKSFISKFILFWPKRKEPVEDEDEHHRNKKKLDTDDYFLKQAEERKRMRDLNRFAFSFYDTDKDHYVNILDLIKLSTQFDDTSDLGREINTLMQIYQNQNVRPKYVKERQMIDFERFNQIIPESCIIREL